MGPANLALFGAPLHNIIEANQLPSTSRRWVCGQSSRGGYKGGGAMWRLIYFSHLDNEALIARYTE